MATKAERQRYLDERHKPPRPKRPPPRQKRRPTQDQGARNLSKHGERKSTVVAEESFGKRPSRKSTRKGVTRTGGPYEHLREIHVVGPTARNRRRL